MLSTSKTKTNFFNNNYFQKDKRPQYISRSTNKKISSEKNNKNKSNKKQEEKYKISSTLMEMNMNRFQNQNNKSKKYTSEFFQNNSLYNLMTKNQNNNINSKNNIKVISIPKTKLLLQENSANNSSIIFNINEDQKMKNNNSIISSNKQNNNNPKILNGETKSKNKNSYTNKELENKKGINIQKYSSKKIYENNMKNYGKYINSNNYSKEENITKNKNNFNCNKNGNNQNYNNNEIFIDSNNTNNNNNNINYITYHKNKNNINNKYILQKILSNLFSSNKKKNNIKKDNNNNRENKYINDSFNNKMTNNKNNNINNINNFWNNNNDIKNFDKRRETPKLKSNNLNNKKISGLFSANHNEKDSNIITDISNSKSKKVNENLTKRNLSINIHSYNINECKFKTSINYEIINKKQDNIPKLNLNQVFNLKLYDKNKINNNSNYSSNNNISIKKDRNKIENSNKYIEKNQILYYINNSNNINKNDNFKNKTNLYNSNTIQNYNKKNEQNTNQRNNNNTNKNNTNNTNNKKNKFSPKNIYTKDLRKSHLQRFFSYSKENANTLKNNIIFMNNIKKIDFNENKKSISKNSTRRWVRSNDNKNNKSQGSKGESKPINKQNNCNSSSKYKKTKERINDTYINLRKRRAKYSEINKIIEINNLKCLKYINNSEINNLKKYNNNFNTNETIKNNINQRKNNHSASHNNLNNNKGKYDISRIGNLFKPIMEKNIRGSYKEANRKKYNLDFVSSLGNKNKNKTNNNNYSNKKNKNKNKDNIIQNKKNETYNSSQKDSNYNSNNANNNQIEIEEIVNLEIDEDKTKENIFQNSLTMYSIYIISKYYNKCDKIGIEKIAIYDKNKKLIPIEYSNTNEGININYLFEMNSQYGDSNTFPLITDFKENFCINFYIKNINNSFFDYIYIYNYSDVNNGISPVQEIKIFRTNILLYKGNLDLNNPNVIKISNYCTGEENKENIDMAIKEKYDIIKKNEKSLTFTIFKSLINENLDTNDNNFNNFKITKFNSARNTFHTNRYSEETNYNKNINYNNINGNDNISNSFVNNYEYRNENDNDNENDISDNILFYQTKCDNTNNNNNLFFNTHKELSNPKISNINYFGNDYNMNAQIENENNFSKTLKLPNYSNKLFLSSYNSAFDDVDNLFRTSIGYVYKQEDSENNNNINENNINDNNNDIYNNNVDNNNVDNNENNININDYNNNNFFFNNNDIGKNYIEFNKINLILKSNYGHRKYIGLTGIIFIDDKNEKIDIEKAKTIGALPKDLRTEYNDDSDNRIFENVFNGINNTNDADNMWVTKFKKKEKPPYMELIFEEKIKLSKIIIYNYNQKDKLEIGTKIIEIYLDNYFYKTIYLIQGTGEISNNNNNLYDFGQEIFLNNEYENINFPDKFGSTGLTYYDNQENKNIKYASNLFDQCYETPYLPSGIFIKIQFLSYYFDKNENLYNNIEENEFYLGLKNIEIFNEEGINVLNYNNNENKKYNYKLVSNRELIRNIDSKNSNSINIKGIYNEDENQNLIFDNENNIFYLFDQFVQISYIKFTPINNEINNFNNKNIYKVKDIKIFCEEKIIFEGELYNNKPTIILFTSDIKLTGELNKNYLTKNFNERKIEEIETDNYFSLILN